MQRNTVYVGISGVASQRGGGKTSLACPVAHPGFDKGRGHNRGSVPSSRKLRGLGTLTPATTDFLGFLHEKQSF